MLEHIINRFNAHIDLSSRCLEPLTPMLNKAVHQLSASMLNQGKVMCSASLASTMVAEQFCYYMQHSFRHERPALPVVNLANIKPSALEKNLHTLASEGDCLLFFQHPECKHNLNSLLNTCKSLNVEPIVCHGLSATQNYLNKSETFISIPSQDTPSVLEIQWLIMHTLCELIDLQIFNLHDL